MSAGGKDPTCDFAHFGARHLPEALPALVLLLLLANLLHELAAILGYHGHVRGGVPERQHRLALLCIHVAAVQEWRLGVMDEQNNPDIVVVLKVCFHLQQQSQI